MITVTDMIFELENAEHIPIEKSFQYAKICSEYLRDEKNENDGRKIIINILNNWKKIDESTYEMWTDLIEAAGFYPYLEKEKNNLLLKNTAGEIRKEFHKSDKLDKYFHEEQYVLNKFLDENKNLIVSAPTSFGKTLLIYEIVASKKFNNIVIIQPSLALINETRNNLKEYITDYKIIVRTSQKYSKEKRNLFLFTAERLMEYPELPKIDFFVIDEFYKLSTTRDKERSDVLNNAVNLLLTEHKSRFYMLGPNIGGISKGFAEKYKAVYYETDYSLVDNRIINMHSEKFGRSGNKKIAKEKALFDLLFKLQKEQTIIYCSSPDKVNRLSRAFCQYLKEKNVSGKKMFSIIEWIEQNVDSKWGLIDCLRHKIGTHNGALQKHITSSIIQYFNNKEISYLFCTSTIIEGVNTSAKNVVFFDNTKGGVKIDFFDYSNIKGRSGRMMEHYVGKVFNFNIPPEGKKIVVTIPFFEQKNISDEVLIHIPKKDIKNKDTDQFKALEKIPKEERQIFKNNGVSVRGQKAILDKLKKDIPNNRELICWDRYPNSEQLSYVLTLAWDNLLKKSESKWPMTSDELVNMIYIYAYKKTFYSLVAESRRFLKKFKQFREKKPDEFTDCAITFAFKTYKRWFQYKVPKWLSVIHNLQKYVAEKNNVKPGNYMHFSSQIENDFLDDNLKILVEYSIPLSAIAKIKENIPKELSDDEILDAIRDKKIIESSDLIEYEKEKIRENIL